MTLCRYWKYQALSLICVSKNTANISLNASAIAFLSEVRR